MEGYQMKKHSIMTLTLYHLKLVYYFIVSKKKKNKTKNKNPKKPQKQRFILAQLTPYAINCEE